MGILDHINTTGMGEVWFASQGIDKGWKMKRGMLSPAYTIRWSELFNNKIKYLIYITYIKARFRITECAASSFRGGIINQMRHPERMRVSRLVK